jgi:hypothetical protein
MKKKTLEVNSKITKKALKEGAIFNMPNRLDVGIKIGAVQATKTTIQALSDTLEIGEDMGLGNDFKEVIEPLYQTNKMFSNLQALELLEILYSEHRNLDGWALGFNGSFSKFRVSKESKSDVSSLADVKAELMDFHRRIEERISEPDANLQPEDAEALAGLLKSAKALDLPSKEAESLATDMIYLNQKMEEYHKAKESNPDARVTEYFSKEDAKKLIETKGRMKELLVTLKASDSKLKIEPNTEGGIA